MKIFSRVTEECGLYDESTFVRIAAFERTKRCACPYKRPWRPPATLTYRYDPFESPRRAVTIYRSPMDPFA